MTLLHSRKFWIAVFDVFISSLTYFLPKYLNPTLGEHVLWLIAAWQPIFYALISGTTQEDVALKRSGTAYDRATKSYIPLPGTIWALDEKDVPATENEVRITA